MTGSDPMGNGKKRKFIDFKKQIDEGKQVIDIACDEENFGTFV